MISPADIARNLKKWNTAAWMDTSAEIAHPSGDIGPMDCNEFQREVSRIVQWCHDNERPARIIILKPRRRGSSTVSVACGYRRLQARRGTGCIAGGSHFQGKKLFKMLEIYANTDKTDPGTCEVLSDIARFSNGSEMDRMTLANPSAGRAGGYQYLVITEMAFLAKEGVADAGDVVAGLIKTVQFEPDTIIIMESTANGASGDFYERWKDGISFEEAKKGRNGFIRVFYAWFQFADLRMDPASEGIESSADYTAEERELAVKWSLDIEQVTWMRYAIRQECKNDFGKFCEDYPFDAESAFRGSGRARFDVEALKAMRAEAISAVAEVGYLTPQHGETVSFSTQSDGSGEIMVWERPIEGMRYLIHVDPATDESQTISANPDRHSVCVWRKGFHDSRLNKWRPAKVVARLKPPFYGDGDVVAGHVARLSFYYGKCIVGIEQNCGIDQIRLLRAAGVPIHKRRALSARTNQTVEMDGFRMGDKQERNALIEGFAAAIRLREIEIPCLHFLDECMTFIVRANGRAEASQGHHDDDVLGGCIAWELMPNATEYRRDRINTTEDPEDLNGWRRRIL